MASRNVKLGLTKNCFLIPIMKKEKIIIKSFNYHRDFKMHIFLEISKRKTDN